MMRILKATCQVGIAILPVSVGGAFCNYLNNRLSRLVAAVRRLEA